MFFITLLAGAAAMSSKSEEKDDSFKESIYKDSFISRFDETKSLKRKSNFNDFTRKSETQLITK